MKLFAKWTTMLLLASGFIFVLANGLTRPPASAQLGGNFYPPTAQTIDISPLSKTIGTELQQTQPITNFQPEIPKPVDPGIEAQDTSGYIDPDILPSDQKFLSDFFTFSDSSRIEIVDINTYLPQFVNGTTTITDYFKSKGVRSFQIFNPNSGYNFCNPCSLNKKDNTHGFLVANVLLKNLKNENFTFVSSYDTIQQQNFVKYVKDNPLKIFVVNLSIQQGLETKEEYDTNPLGGFYPAPGIRELLPLPNFYLANGTGNDGAARGITNGLNFIPENLAVCSKNLAGNNLASFSNWASTDGVREICVAGENVPSTNIDGKSFPCNGTSCAGPSVAQITAGILENYSSASRILPTKAELYELLKDTSYPITASYKINGTQVITRSSPPSILGLNKMDTMLAVRADIENQMKCIAGNDFAVGFPGKIYCGLPPSLYGQQPKIEIAGETPQIFSAKRRNVAYNITPNSAGTKDIKVNGQTVGRVNVLDKPNEPYAEMKFENNIPDTFQLGQNIYFALDIKNPYSNVITLSAINKTGCGTTKIFELKGKSIMCDFNGVLWPSLNPDYTQNLDATIKPNETITLKWSIPTTQTGTFQEGFENPGYSYGSKRTKMLCLTTLPNGLCGVNYTVVPRTQPSGYWVYLPLVVKR